MDSSEDEGVVVKKSPSFDSSDEEVTVKKKKAVIESDGDDDIRSKISDRNEKMDTESSDDERPASQEPKRKGKIKRPLDSDSDSSESSNTKTVSPNSQFSQSLLKNKELNDAESSDEELRDLKYTSQV